MLGAQDQDGNERRYRYEGEGAAEKQGRRTRKGGTKEAMRVERRPRVRTEVGDMAGED